MRSVSCVWLFSTVRTSLDLSVGRLSQRSNSAKAPNHATTSSWCVIEGCLPAVCVVYSDRSTEHLHRTNQLKCLLLAVLQAA
jgi:hypothetical protein